jgi:hypothetical protein
VRPVITVVSYLLLPAGLIVCSAALLRGTAWARHRLFQVVALVGLWGLASLLSWGFRLPNGRNAIDLAIALAFMLLLTRPAVKKHFPYRKTLKRTVVTAGVIAALLIGGVIVMWFMSYGYDVPRLKSVEYDPIDTATLVESLETTPFPLEFEVAVPEGFTLVQLSRNDSLGHVSVEPVLGTVDCYIVLDDNPVYPGPPPKYFAKLGCSAYDYYRATITEPCALLFIILRGIWWAGTERIDEVKVNGLDCIVTWHAYRDSEKLFKIDYQIFDRGEVVGDVVVFLRKPGQAGAEEVLRRIVMSTRLRHGPARTAEEYYNEGIRRLEKQDARSAALAFASSLILGWENADCHYRLSRIQFESEYLSSARDHAEEAIRLRPDFHEAVALLAEIEQAEAEREAGVGTSERDWVGGSGRIR